MRRIPPIMTATTLLGTPSGRRLTVCHSFGGNMAGCAMPQSSHTPVYVLMNKKLKSDGELAGMRILPPQALVQSVISRYHREQKEKADAAKKDAEAGERQDPLASGQPPQALGMPETRAGMRF